MTVNDPLLLGVATAVVFVDVPLIEGARQSGYDPRYHTISELSLGDRGWIQIANFIQMGVGTFTFSIGIHASAIRCEREPGSDSSANWRSKPPRKTSKPR